MSKEKTVKVYVTLMIPDPGIELLKAEGFEVTVWHEEGPVPHNDLVSVSKAHNALLSSGSNRLDSFFLNQCSHLDIVSQFAVGFDNIDIDEATKLGIPIGNTPDVLSGATADVAFGLMINVSRKMFYMHKSIGRGEWKYFRAKANLGIELNNKVLGVYGLGRIGAEMAKRCKGAYNMQIIYHNRSRNISAERELGAKYVSFNELLEKSDVLSVHTSLTNETRGKFDKKAFEKMKPSAIFINTARGAVHVEKDLKEALDEKVIWGAGLDVTDPEPMAHDDPLLDMETVAVLPHVGSATVETRNRMSELAAMNIIEFYRGNQIPGLVNPEVFKTNP